MNSRKYKTLVNPKSYQIKEDFEEDDSSQKSSKVSSKAKNPKLQTKSKFLDLYKTGFQPYKNVKSTLAKTHTKFHRCVTP